MTKSKEPSKKELVRTDGYKKEVWFIHGANASPSSFNHIRDSLESDPDFSDYAFVDISYDCQEKLDMIVKVLAQSASKDKEIYFIGHSLGGVLATAIAQRVKHFELPVTIKAVMSMGSPYGGSESADYLRWLYPHYPLFRSVSTKNRLIIDLQAAGAAVPTLALVTSSGNNPLFPTANDGVVTVNSQRALPGATYIELPYNHFEVLMSAEAVQHIKLFMKQH